MKIDWNMVGTMVIALAIAFLLNEFLIAPAAEWVMGKVSTAFEAE